MKIFYRIISLFLCFLFILSEMPALAKESISASKTLSELIENINYVGYDVDDDGKILVVKEENIDKIWYFYDEQNQLIRENNSILGKTIVYSYDIRGNIQSKKIYNFTMDCLDDKHVEDIIVYGYNDLDEMISYNGTKITYDELGNPINYRDDWNFKWENSLLLEASKPGINIKYVYNEDGRRIKKIVNDVTTDFDFINDLVLKNDSNTLRWYLPDEDKAGYFNYNGKDYAYLYNLQGDIIGITDEQNNVVARYTYDTWGKLLSIVDENGNDVTNDINNIGYINPLRYRGYYYDSETNLYYLNSRYYDPETGRFLSRDDEEYLKVNNIDIQDCSLYCYCLNNPVNMVDCDGHNPYALSVLMANPELAVAALAVYVVMTPILLRNPKLKGIVDDAISWAIRACVTSASAILARFRELGRKLADKIAELVKSYNIYMAKQKVPSKLKLEDGRVDLSKFDTPSEINKGGRGKKPSQGPQGWEIRPVPGTPHRGDKWKLYYRNSRIASLKPDGTIVAG